MSLPHIGDMDRAFSCWREALKYSTGSAIRAAEIRARLAGQLGVVAGQPVLGAHEDADHAFGGAGVAFDVGVGAFGAEVAAGEGPALPDGDGVLDRGDRSLG